MEPFFPDFVQVDFSVFNCFKFRLPATAMGINDPMIVEVVVEYGERAATQSALAACAWAREPQGVISGFISNMEIPAKANEPSDAQAERLFHALNEDDVFIKQLTQFIKILIKNRK